MEAGHPPGSPYPHVGSFVPGWDSHAPLSWIYEDPSACNLVPVEDTIPINERNAFLRAAGLDVRRELTNLRIVHFDGNTAMRRSLEALPIAEYDSCMTFADQAMETEMMHSDSHVRPAAFFLLLRGCDRAATRRSSRRCSSSARSSSTPSPSSAS